jgi:hypothetical protein
MVDTLLAAPDRHHHHHQITKLSHSINAIVFATITHIPSLHKIRRNAPRYHPTNPLATPNIIRNKTQQLGRCIRQCQNIAQFFSATNNLAQNRTRPCKSLAKNGSDLLPTTDTAGCARLCGTNTACWHSKWFACLNDSVAHVYTCYACPAEAKDHHLHCSLRC